MRLLVIAAAIAVGLAAPAAPQLRGQPFVPVGVWYGGGPVSPPAVTEDPAPQKDAWRRDLKTIRSLGFNSITAWVSWGSAEPSRGRYQLAALDQLLALAEEAGLAVIVQIYATPPAWMAARYADGRIVERPGAAPGRGAFCLDHPGVRTDAAAFIGAVAARAAAHRSFHGIDVGGGPVTAAAAAPDAPSGVCYCQYTRTRFREWRTATFGAAPPNPEDADWRTFFAVKFREDLEMEADASAPRGARPVSAHLGEPWILRAPAAAAVSPDEWWMAHAVDHRGTALYPAPAGRRARLEPATLATALDAMRSAARDRGWWLSELQAGPAPAVSAADVRLWGWAAIARGARSIAYSTWHPGSAGHGLLGADGSLTDRARAAGELAGNIARNPALYGPLRPRASRAAAVYDRGMPEGPAAAQASRDRALGFFRTMFEDNIQADFIHPDEIVAGMGSRYDVIYTGPAPLPPAAAESLTAFARGGGTIVSGTATPSRIREMVAAAGVKPDVTIEGGKGLVEARFLESADAMLLVAINHARGPQRVTMRFTPETPEAIWQNMESGASVNFVQGPAGPFYTHSFGARDVVVLVRGKRLR